ncbi:MAG: enoyl-CoA hydratase/isomerase family protein [Sciscionella sp.]
MTDEPLVRLHREGGIAHVVLDSPDTGNRVTHQMITELIDRLDAAAGSDVLLIGANGDDFSLGRDQSQRPPGVSSRDALDLILGVNQRIADFAGVSVALVAGRALGFGSGLAVQCDITVVADNAVLGFDEITHGFPPLIVQSYLDRYLPRKAVLDLVLTGRSVAAEEARALGMASRVVAVGELEPEGARICAALCDSNTSALRRAKSFLVEIEEVPVPQRPAYGARELVSWRSHEG